MLRSERPGSGKTERLHLHRRLAMPSRCFIFDDAYAELNVLIVLVVLDNDNDVENDNLDDHDLYIVVC